MDNSTSESLLNTTYLSPENSLSIRYYDPYHKYERQNTAQYQLIAGFADFAMCSYVYFIPRLIAYRCITIGDEKKKPNFWMMTYLMTTILLLSVSNICRCFNFASEPTVFSTVFWYSTVTSFQQSITVLVSFLCIQQLGELDSFQYSHIFLEGFFQHIFFILTIMINFTTNFWIFIKMFSEEGYSDGDRRPAYVQDIVLPIITFLIYNSVRMRLRRERYYEQSSGTDDGKPNVTDRMGKIAWYQGIIALAMIASIIWDFQDQDLNDITYMTIYGQTPVLSVVSFISILRKKRPTRPCFLLCCTEEDGVSRTQSTGTRVGASG